MRTLLVRHREIRPSESVRTADPTPLVRYLADHIHCRRPVDRAHLSESEWKYLSRQLQPLALDRFYRLALADVAQIATDDATDSHARYRAVFQLIEERNRELAAAFDGLRRSTAFWQLMRMWSFGLVADEELGEFRHETRDAIRTLMTSRNR